MAEQGGQDKGATRTYTKPTSTSRLPEYSNEEQVSLLALCASVFGWFLTRLPSRQQHLVQATLRRFHNRGFAILTLGCWLEKKWAYLHWFGNSLVVGEGD